MNTLIIARNTAHKSLLASGLCSKGFTVAVLGDRFTPDQQFTAAVVCELHTADATFLAKHRAWIKEVVAPQLADGVVVEL